MFSILGEFEPRCSYKNNNKHHFNFFISIHDIRFKLNFGLCLIIFSCSLSISSIYLYLLFIIFIFIFITGNEFQASLLVTFKMFISIQACLIFFFYDIILHLLIKKHIVKYILLKFYPNFSSMTESDPYDEAIQQANRHYLIRRYFRADKFCAKVKHRLRQSHTHTHTYKQTEIHTHRDSHTNKNTPTSSPRKRLTPTDTYSHTYRLTYIITPA